MYRRISLAFITSLTIILAITPAYAAPSLAIGSNASYNLAGRIQANQNCSAAPVNLTSQACSGSTTPPPPLNVTLNGAGSTFVFPLISVIDSSYTSVNPSVRVNYQAVGSGAGVASLTAKTVDFAASDAPLTNIQMVNAPNTLTIPDTIGAVAVSYNLPGISKGLQLNATVIAEIFQGNITTWNDSNIRALNPALTLPSNPITIVHRSDSSGTTFVFSSYLNSTSVWRLGVSKTVTWPASSIGANGNQGVASIVQGTQFTIGYVELDYALSASPPLSYAYLWNPTGNAYIAPSLSSTALAVSTVTNLPAGNGNWQTVTLVNSSNPGAYPIVSFSYIIVYQELNVYGAAMTQNRAADLVEFLTYVVHGGQSLAPALNFAPLTANVASIDDATIKSITYNGQTPSPSLPPSPVTTPPPMPTSFQLNLNGNVGWNVEGLDSQQVNLLESHSVGLSVSPIPLITFTPVTESGSFEQSINLSTRVESPGTASGLARSLLTSIAGSASSALGGSSGSAIQTMLTAQASNPDYTEWWVNGPLSNGSPVQIVNGWSSVTGSETLNLGTSLGSRPAWIVTSALSQTFNLNIPNVSSPLGTSSTATASANLSLLWSFDKSSDLLLRNNSTLSLTMHSVTPTTIFTSVGTVSATVTRDMAITLDLTMLLSSTNVGSARPHGASTLTDMFASMPWIPLGIGGLVAGVTAAALAFWLSKRARTTSSQPPSQPSAPAQPATPSVA